MRRSENLKVAVFCPHFRRTVTAEKNLAVDRLVACSDSEQCRDPAAAPHGDEPVRPYPHGCPVFPQLAK